MESLAAIAFDSSRIMFAHKMSLIPVVRLLALIQRIRNMKLRL